MDEADGTERGLTTSPETGVADKGCMDSERPRPEGADAARIEHLPSSGEGEAPRMAAEGEKVVDEGGLAARRGSAGSHRSRHSSGGSSSSSTRSRRRSHSRHRSKRGDGAEEGEQPRPALGLARGQPSRAGGQRSRTQTHQLKETVSADWEEPSASGDEEGDCSVVHIDSIARGSGDERSASSGRDNERKKMAKLGKKLKAKKMKYLTEKQLLKAKMETARKDFEEEVSKYERELDGKRQEMQMKVRDLKVDEQYGALSQRMDELAGFREELDSRFAQCMEYEKEIEEIERYLARRQELCNSKEEDLRLLDEQLDMLHQELELDKERLERAGFDATNMAPRKRTAFSRSPQKGTERDEDDYILKANLRKCQNDLKKAEQSVHEGDVELVQAKEEISLLQSDNRKKREKIKQLETQLSLSLSQLKNHTNSTHPTSGPALNRHASVRSHVSLDRLKSPTDLSINQQAQLNRSLSAGGQGGTSPSGKKSLGPGSSSSYFSSSVSQGGSSEGHRRASSHQGSGGVAEVHQLRPRSSTEGSIKTQQSTVSTACAIM